MKSGGSLLYSVVLIIMLNKIGFMGVLILAAIVMALVKFTGKYVKGIESYDYSKVEKRKKEEEEKKKKKGLEIEKVQNVNESKGIKVKKVSKIKKDSEVKKDIEETKELGIKKKRYKLS